VRTERVVGEHKGLWTLTIGQGARIGGMEERMFVARKVATRNEIWVVPGVSVFLYFTPHLLASCLSSKAFAGTQNY